MASMKQWRALLIILIRAKAFGFQLLFSCAKCSRDILSKVESFLKELQVIQVPLLNRHQLVIQKRSQLEAKPYKVYLKFQFQI